MQWRDTLQHYGIVSRLLHWGMAILLLWQFSPMLAWRAFGQSPVSALVSRIAPHHGVVGAIILLSLPLSITAEQRPPLEKGRGNRDMLTGCWIDLKWIRSRERILVEIKGNGK